jgi:hypothetical protein
MQLADKYRPCGCAGMLLIDDGIRVRPVVQWEAPASNSIAFGMQVIAGAREFRWVILLTGVISNADRKGGTA